MLSELMAVIGPPDWVMGTYANGCSYYHLYRFPGNQHEYTMVFIVIRGRIVEGGTNSMVNFGLSSAKRLTSH